MTQNARPPTDQADNDVNHNNQARVADPRSKRDKILHSLPPYSGPYPVGMIDIEVPVAEPRTFADITRHKRHLLQLETVLFSIFYPAADGTGFGKDPTGRSEWSRETWLPRPRSETAKGYGRFAGIPATISVPFFMSTTWLTKIPAFRNAALADHYPIHGNVKAGEGSSEPSAVNSSEDFSSPPKFPLIVFSHGLGGTRTTSSSLCGAFASYGFIVIAMEHRDGTSARTFVNHPSKGTHSENAAEPAIDHSQEELKQGFDRIDYIFPKDNPIDTDPHHTENIDNELRGAQIEMRKAEILELKRIMTEIHAGRGAQIAAQNLRDANSKGRNVRGLQGIDWSSWKDRFHLKQATMIGHSFGAATAIQVLRDNKNFPGFTQGIALDPWAAVIPPVGDGTISVPLLTINSEAFMWWKDNFTAAKRVAEEAAKDHNLSWLMTIRGSVHLSQTDIPILYPRICSALLKMTSDPKRAIEITLNASLEFLRLVMPQRISAMNRGKQEGFLDVGVTEQLPEDLRPDNKWIGMRLRIPHELFTRARNRKRRGKGWRFERFAEEIWMHVKPGKEDVVMFRPKEVE